MKKQPHPASGDCKEFWLEFKPDNQKRHPFGTGVRRALIGAEGNCALPLSATEPLKQANRRQLGTLSFQAPITHRTFEKPSPIAVIAVFREGFFVSFHAPTCFRSFAYPIGQLAPNAWGSWPGAAAMLAPAPPPIRPIAQVRYPVLSGAKRPSELRSAVRAVWSYASPPEFHTLGS